MKSYLMLEKGVIEERFFHLEERLTIGRRPSNDVHLTDPSVSRQHAVVYLSEGSAVVEDLGSTNGTFVNGERVKKTSIFNGDTLRVGNVIFRFVQEEVKPSHSLLTTTQELPESDITVSFEDKGLPSRSRRLTEAISKVPLFFNLEEEEVINISRAAHLVVFDRGRTIIQEGDRGKSVYVILDGRVRVFTYDQQGKEVVLAYLSEDQFFGEIAFLRGTPRTATVQALQETLLCEISFKAMREILERRPTIKEQLERYCQERSKEREIKKREAGIIDRRSHSRLKEKLPVSFSISPTSPAAGQFQKRVFRSLSHDISVSGIRIQVQDRALLGLPLGCQLRLEIALPHPWGTIRCLGTLRNIVEGKSGQDFGYLGVEFVELPQVVRSKLEGFLRGE